MTIDESVAFAVEGKQLLKPAPAVKPESHSALTGRQLDIARLITDDLSNKQIAARLFLSECTVETQVTNIPNKLGPQLQDPDQPLDDRPERAQADHGRETAIASQSSLANPMCSPA